MATVFYDGMPNVNEVLNQLYTAFAAGPYNAVPLTGGTMTGPLRTPLAQVEKLFAGYSGDAVQHVIARGAAVQGEMVLSIVGVADFNKTTSGFGNPAATALAVTRNTDTNRSITAPGSINANGADYAEYLIKRGDCGTVSPGQIVGIDADGKITDKWAYAISFAVKSTNPSLVGGDTWWQHLGPRPETPIWQPGYTDAQWVAAQAAYNSVAIAYNTALEAARAKADRIAFCGQVPVNLQSGAPGQYLVPAQDGAGISAVFVDESDITLPQYLRALGRVIALEEDGRARIIVKVV